MKMKLALGVVVPLTAIALNAISSENSTNIVIGNETIYEANESIAEIKDEIENESAELNTSILEEPKAEIKPIEISTKNPTKSKSSNSENHTENEPENVNPDSNSPQGKAYVEGFGCVEDSGPAQGKTVHSDGDINKMVGTMD